MSFLLNLFRNPVQFYFSRLFSPLRSKCSTLAAGHSTGLVLPQKGSKFTKISELKLYLHL